MTTPIIGNDWRSLVPPSETTWTPTRRVSVCIPAAGPGEGIDRTLAVLAAQTYPHHLFEVVVGFDRVDEPSAAPKVPFHVEVAARERATGFGAGTARNTAARQASGDIIFFLDADVLPERQVIESYARWFDLTDLAVPMGFLRFVDLDVMTTADIVDVIANGEMATRFADSDVDDQSYRERTLARTHDLSIEAIDAFRIAIGATIAVHVDHYRDVGGFPERGVRGVEDTEFGYRLHNNGGLLIADRDARHWHHGARNLTSDRRAEIEAARAPYVRRVLPVPGFRKGEPAAGGPVETVPVFTVHVQSGPDELVRLTTASVFEHEGVNVVVGSPTIDAGVYSPVFGHVIMPAGARWGKSTRRELLTIFREQQVGVIRAIGTAGGVSDIVAIRSRCVRRAHQCAPDRDAIDHSMETFGCWWTELSVIDVVVAEPAVDNRAADSAAAPAAAEVDAAVAATTEERKFWHRPTDWMGRKFRNSKRAGKRTASRLGARVSERALQTLRTWSQ